MKRYSLLVLITLMAFSASIAAPVKAVPVTGTASFYQVKKKSTKKHHKKHHKKHQGKKNAAAK
jgi:hypothetical protein